MPEASFSELLLEPERGWLCMRGDDLKNSMLPDVRLPQAVLHLRNGSSVVFSVDRADPVGFRVMVPIDLDIDRAIIKLAAMQSMRNSTGDTIEVPATIKKVCAGIRIAVERTIPRNRANEADSGSSLSLRQSSRNGAVNLGLKLNDEKRQAAPGLREKVEANLLPGHPCTVKISTYGVRLATHSLPTPISLNDINIKVGRTSATFEVSLPAAQCSPLGATTPLPRAISDGRASGLLSALPLASDDILGSLSDPNSGWLNRDLKGRTVARAIRMSRSRVLGDRVCGEYWGGRGPVLLLAKDGSPDVLVLLASDVRYDWAYGLLITGAACILTEEIMRKVAAEIFGSLSPKIRPESMDPLSDEASLWREHYLPAAVELARVTRLE
ncbi:hypothetical protein FOL47_011077 [Perkinsus chesapeaki]|uniref:Uncharacterized protein n=1 Tax=Perkinsus chesapeaki TaxID=330153 RepID=A0A7J6KZ55_PERCH|nr:hypothetical protein FOL47_011077 [Perkinsus chesapeaki]